MWRLINVTHWRKGCEKHGIKAACGPTTHTCCTMCLQSWWWWRWLSLVLLCFSLLTPVSPLQLLEVNKQWDQHFRSMKQQYEQKVL